MVALTLSGLARRPIAHMCDCMLELPSTYLNYDEFHSDFTAIFDEVPTDTELMLCN